MDIELELRKAKSASERDQLVIEALVKEAKKTMSWSEIGNALGTSKQAAQMRYGPKIKDKPLIV